MEGVTQQYNERRILCSSVVKGMMVIPILLNVTGGFTGVPFCDHNLKKKHYRKSFFLLFIIDFMVGQVQPEKLKKVF